MTETFEGLKAVIAPVIVMIIGMVVLLLDLGEDSKQRKYLPLVSYMGLMLAAVGAFASLGQQTLGAGVEAVTYFGGGMVSDSLGGLFCMALCIVAGFSLLMSGKYLEEKALNHGEFYALILFATSGSMLMALSYDLVNVFVGLEILSVALYILSGFARRERRSEESAVKYFLLGAFASGFLLYGTALIYGAVGLAAQSQGLVTNGQSFTNFGVIADVLRGGAGSANPLVSSPIFVTGVALVLVGLGFKAAIAPFHFYAPDVYEGAPTPVTAFMSVAAKIGAFAALIRLFSVLLTANGAAPFHGVLWGLAVATMVIGNVLAVRQTSIKRMLAYSSIAHAGYILVGILASGKPASQLLAQDAIRFYLFAYAFMNLGAFALIIWLGRGAGQEYREIRDYAGLARRQPLAAATMAIFMLSLAGVPPAAGFLGKLYLFLSAVQAGEPLLAAVGLVVSAIGVYYYLNIIVTMYFREPVNDFDQVRGGGAKVVALLSALATIVFGIVPTSVLPTLATPPQSPLVPAASLPSHTTPSETGAPGSPP